MNAGMARAAKIPRIATTIISSIRVKPDFFFKSFAMGGVSVPFCDERVAKSELMTIKYFATTWDLEPPAMDGVDWDSVAIR